MEPRLYCRWHHCIICKIWAPTTTSRNCTRYATGYK